MATRSWRWTALVGMSLFALGASAACSAEAPPIMPRFGSDSADVTQAGQSSATPVAGPDVDAAVLTAAPAAPAAPATPAALSTSTALQVGPRPVAVRRDTIIETLELDGLVASEAEVPITYPSKAVVSDIKVAPGQSVNKGDVLVEIDNAELTRSLDAARTHLQASQANLVQAQAQTQLRQQTAVQQAAIEQQRQQQVATDATLTLRHAQENLAKVQAGASLAERAAVQNALNAAEGVLQKAQDAQAKLADGPDADAVRAAQREVTTDQIALARAQADLNTLTRGPDPAALRDAQGQVQRAQTQLQLAQAAPIDPRADQAVSRIQHDAAIQDAQAAVQAAQDRLAKLKLPPPDPDVQSAKQRVQDAQDTLLGAQTKLSALQAGPDDAAMQAAQTTVDSAQQGVAIAQAQLNQVLSRPTPSELADATDQVRKAQATIDGARGTLPLPRADADVDFSHLQNAVDEDQAVVSQLEDALDKTHVRAPFDATIVAVRAKAADPISSLKPILTIAQRGAAIVHVDLADDEAARLAVGQKATVRFANGSVSATPLAATVAALTPAAPDGTKGASASFQVDWEAAQTPRLRVPVLVSVTLQEKAGALVVPKSAIRKSGSVTSVQVMNGTLRSQVNVKVGITTASSTEILSGLSEGQLVVAGAA